MECILNHLRDLSSKHFGGPNATAAVWLATENPKEVIPAVSKALARHYGPTATLLTYPNAEKLGFVHTFKDSSGPHGFEKDLYLYVDWHLLGEADAIYGFGTPSLGVGAALARDFRDPRAHAQGHRADQGARVLSGRVAPSAVRPRSPTRKACKT